MAITWDKTTHDLFYRTQIGWADPDDPANTKGERIGEQINYGKDFARYASRGPLSFWYYRKYVRRLVKELELTPDQRIFDVGCSFGFLMSCFKDASVDPEIGVDFPFAYGIDASSWMEDNIAKEQLSDVDILFMDFAVADVQLLDTELVGICGHNDFDVIINHVIESLNPKTDLAPLDKWLDLLESRLANKDFRLIINMVDNDLIDNEKGDEEAFQTLRDYEMETKSLDDWAAIRPSHTWYGLRSDRLIVGN